MNIRHHVPFDIIRPSFPTYVFVVPLFFLSFFLYPSIHPSTQIQALADWLAKSYNLYMCMPRVGHPLLQESLASAGALEILLSMLKTGDVDVLECASAAMANMVSSFEPNAIRVGKAGGVEILAGR